MAVYSSDVRSPAPHTAALLLMVRNLFSSQWRSQICSKSRQFAWLRGWERAELSVARTLASGDQGRKYLVGTAFQTHSMAM